MKPERIDTESGTNHENGTNQEHHKKNRESPASTPLQWK